MAPEYVPLLDAATLDFVELDVGEPQFIFLNPNDPGYVPPSGRLGRCTPVRAPRSPWNCLPRTHCD